ncbi:hypothetical protein [Candidatus Nitrososphaera sp. FF02]|jgi:hypothetical protein
MRATQPPRRCKCDECQDTYVTLQEMDLFAPAERKPGRGAIAVAN